MWSSNSIYRARQGNRKTKIGQNIKKLGFWVGFLLSKQPPDEPKRLSASLLDVKCGVV